jgi:hypothetical protein
LICTWMADFSLLFPCFLSIFLRTFFVSFVLFCFLNLFHFFFCFLYIFLFLNFSYFPLFFLHFCSLFFSSLSAYHSFIHSFIHPSINQWLYSPLLGPGLFFSFVIIFTQTLGLLGRVISQSRGRYLHTGQHKQNKRTHTHPCLEWYSNPRS